MHRAGRGEHVLDLETLWMSHELPERWGDLHRMRVTCCVLHDVGPGRTWVFSKEPLPGTLTLERLYWYLEACRSEGCTVVGHNLRSFDWEVLAGEWEARGLVRDHRLWGPGAARLVDTLASLHAKLGWRPSLDSLAHHNLGEGKSMDGSLAPGLWRRGLQREVIAYCRRDVDLTSRVWLKGRAEGKVAVARRPDGTMEYVPVEW